MEVHFTPEQEARLEKAAEAQGIDMEAFVKTAGIRLLEDAAFREAVLKGLEQANRGDFIEEEEMEVRIQQMLRS